MGVKKFRTFDEARRALWLPGGDPTLLARMRRLGELHARRDQRRGVSRFRTIEEAKGLGPTGSVRTARASR